MGFLYIRSMRMCPSCGQYNAMLKIPEPTQKLQDLEHLQTVHCK